MPQSLPDLHLEISSKCALACSACPRTYLKGHYKVTDLPLASIQRLVKSPMRYRMVTLCGDHGDPIYHSQFHEVILALQQLPDAPYIAVATNGSHRKEDWWRKTAEIMRPKDQFIFGVDGLEDTSHLYRRGNDWNSILRGIEILKSEGLCQVHWQWILFKFNQHQITEAAKLVKSLRLDRFMIVGSSRHSDKDPMRPTISIEDAEREFRRVYDPPPM
jgi:MoaA/NifB/PqqE/SkfB family radical SAM enzyme